MRDRWASAGAYLFTPADLSVSGWRYRVGDPLHSVSIVDGREVRNANIRGVFTRLQWVWETELLDIAKDDRAYISSEMSAFLLCWLSGFTCPVLNRPTTTCLTGPGWGREQWNFAASKAGMRVEPVQRSASLTSSARPEAFDGDRKEVALTVVGNNCIGEVSPILAKSAIRLAKIAEADFLTARFSNSEPDARFLGAHVFPAIDQENIADAALSYFG